MNNEELLPKSDNFIFLPKQTNFVYLPEQYWDKKHHKKKRFGKELTKWIVIVILIIISFGLVVMIDTAHKTTKEKGQE